MKRVAGRIAVILCMLLVVSNIPTSAKSKKVGMKMTPTKMEVTEGEKFWIRSGKPAEVHIRITANEKKGDITVTTKDTKILKIEEIGPREYVVSALKEGKASITIKSKSYKKLKKSLKVIVKKKAQPLVDLTSENFDEEILDYQGRAVIYFGADWCPGCRKLEPMWEEARMDATEIKFCKVNTDDEKELLASHDVRGIPRMFIYEDGELIDERGLWRGMTVDRLVSWLRSYKTP